MNNSISILYYTCNRISDFFANNVRNHLLESSGGRIPIISISHKPIDFGENICVDGWESSVYNIYKQILIGAKKAKTKYVACCEDDTLYVPEHFEHRPPDDTFYYNVNRWHINDNFYFYRHRRGMCMCIAPTKLLISTLEVRFLKYLECPPHFGEPGRHEEMLGLPYVKSEVFKTEIPTLHFIHRQSMGGQRKVLPKDIVEKELPYWGKAEDLFKRFYYECK